MANKQKNVIQDLRTRLKTLEADAQSNPQKKVDAMNALAQALRNVDVAESQRLSQQAHQIATTLEPPYQNGMLHSLSNLGWANYYLGQYDLALQHSLEALNMAETIQNMDQRLMIFQVIGSIYYDLGDYSTALQYFYRYYQVAQQVNDRLNEARALNALGLLYDTTKAHRRALEFYDQSYALYQAQHNMPGVAAVLTNRALAYINLEDYTAALRDGSRAIELTRSHDSDRGEIHSLGVTGVAHFEMGAYDQALHYFEQALSKASTLGLKMLQATAWKEIGKVYQKTAQLDAALQHLQQALEIATAIEAKSEIYECHRYLSEIYEQQQELSKALYHYKHYHQVEKEVFNEAADKKTKNLQVIHETEKAKREAELTRQKNVALEQEITERRRAETAAQQRSAELLMLIEAGQEITATLDLSTVLERIATGAKNLLRADLIAVFWRHPDQDIFRPAFVLGQEADAVQAWRVSLGKGIAGHVAQTGAAEIVNDTAHDPRAIHIPNTTLDNTRIEAMMCAPLVAQEEVIGLIVLWRNTRAEGFTEHDLNFLVGLSQQAAIAIENARLFEEARQAKEEAEAANRTKSIFLANMSHELRTPLSAILGFSELMMRESYSGGDSLTKGQQENLRTILRSGEHLLGLINDVLELSKIEAGHVGLETDVFDLHDMLLGLEEMFHLRAREKGLNLTFDYGRDGLMTNIPRYIQADQRKLRQILINLLGNAVKFTHQGGITLRVKGVGEAASPSRLHFAVEDTGVGIAENELGQLFEMFAQTSSGRASQQGTGLGLPISHKFVRLMGGDLTVHSQVGKGACFEFDIPITIADALDPSRTISAQRMVVGLAPDCCTAPDGSPFRLLIVEDKVENRELLVKTLSSLGDPPIGFELRTVSDGTQAIAAWETWHPHLIWMDVRMPHMDGYAATRHIKSTCQGDTCPIIIVLTASTFKEERATALDAGADDLIHKPFREAEIFDTLSRYLHVKFLYETPHAHTQTDGFDPSTNLLTSQDAIVVELEQVPSIWKNEFHNALLRGDIMQVAASLKQIEVQYPALASVLNNLAENFRYQQLLELIQRAQ